MAETLRDVKIDHNGSGPPKLSKRGMEFRHSTTKDGAHYYTVHNKSGSQIGNARHNPKHSVAVRGTSYEDDAPVEYLPTKKESTNMSQAKTIVEAALQKKPVDIKKTVDEVLRVKVADIIETIKPEFGNAVLEDEIEEDLDEDQEDK